MVVSLLLSGCGPSAPPADLPPQQAPVAAGDLRITEVMAAPEATDDATGEWVELQNTTSVDLDLRDWQLSTAAGAAPLGPLVVPAGGYAVVGRSASWAENGGVPVGAVWTGLDLADDGDTLAISVGDTAVATLTWTVEWSIEAGAALALDVTAGAEQAADPAWWCAAEWRLPSGDRGTPGLANAGCPGIDHDGDGQTEADGDCDDADADVHRDAVERWDGDDDDCDRSVDDLLVDQGWITRLLGAEADDRFGAGGFAQGDVDGDGARDLAIASRSVTPGLTGTVLVLPTEGWGEWPDAALDDLGGTVASGPDGFGLVPGELRDHTGDGQPDLLVGAFDLGGDAPAWHLWAGPLGGGDLAADGAVASGSGLGPVDDAVVAASDLDGDGVAEVVYGAMHEDGRVWVFHTPEDAVGSAEADAVLTGTAGDGLAATILAVDLDGDGHEDLVVGAPTDSAHAEESGAAYVVPGGAVSGTLAVADVSVLTLRGLHSFGHLGDTDAIAAGDLDDDGATDLVVAAPATSEVYAWFAAGALTGTHDAGEFDAAVVSGGLGSLGPPVVVGDADGDGRDDLLLGAASGGVGPAMYLFSDVPLDVLDPELDAQATFLTGIQDPLAKAGILDMGDVRPHVAFSDPVWARATGVVFFLRTD